MHASENGKAGHSHQRIGCFNEAEARVPRKTSHLASYRTKCRARFNEAEASLPRKTTALAWIRSDMSWLQ